MNLNSRISRIEAAHAPGAANVIIAALDEADYQRQLVDVFLGATPGHLTVAGTIGGEPFKQTTELLCHEDALDLL